MEEKNKILDTLPREVQRMVKGFYEHLKGKKFSKLTKNDKEKLKEILKKLYWNYKLSLRKIASLFEKDYDTIYKWFSKLNIRKRSLHEAALPRRNPSRQFLLRLLPRSLRLEIEKCKKEIKPKKVNIPFQLLKKLYIENKLSASKIGILFEVNRKTIENLLKKFKIKTRRSIQKRVVDQKERNFLLKKVKPKIRRIVNEIYNNFKKRKSLGLGISSEEIPKEVLEHLYLECKLSSREIGLLFDLSGAKIRKRLEKYNIPRRSISDALSKYPKRPFIEDSKEMTKFKCYLLGLRCGDLHALIDDKRVVCDVSTTHPAWERLMNELFGNFGFIRKYPFENRKGEYAWRISAYLDRSFSFLVEKLNKVPSEILLNKELFLNFVAGLIDSEGTVALGIYNNYLRFWINITSTDFELLNDVAKGFLNRGFKPLLFQGKINKDHFGKRIVWNLRIGRKGEVKKLLRLLPLRHEEKIKKSRLVLNSGNKPLEEIEKEWKFLSSKIKKDTIKYKELAKKTLKFS